MHQQRATRAWSTTALRYTWALSVAAVPMLALIAVSAMGYCYPGCAIWDSSNPEWHWFLCFLCGLAH